MSRAENEMNDPELKIRRAYIEATLGQCLDTKYLQTMLIASVAEEFTRNNPKYAGFAYVIGRRDQGSVDDALSSYSENQKHLFVQGMEMAVEFLSK